MECAGNERLSDNQQKVGVDGRKADSKEKSAQSEKVSPTGKADVGRALRSVYDTTLNEDVPPEFLDLLGKLD